MPLADLILRAAAVHQANRGHGDIQRCALLSIKTGGCPEDCKYCSQSAHYDSPVDRQPLMTVDEVREAADAGEGAGGDAGSAWGRHGGRRQDGPEFDRVLEMVRTVRGLGMEACVTLGMLTDDQARRLKEAGLTAYNHNLDTSRRFYPEVISTRTYDDRLDTLRAVAAAGITVCCGGIIGMGETEDDRLMMLVELANLDDAAGERADQLPDAAGRHAAGDGPAGRFDRDRPADRHGADRVSRRPASGSVPAATA